MRALQVLDHADTDYVVHDSKWQEIKKAFLGRVAPKCCQKLCAKTKDSATRARTLPEGAKNEATTAEGKGAEGKETGGQGLDFAEFMTCIEGDSIDFATFIKRLPGPPPDKVDFDIIKNIEDHFTKEGGVVPVTRFGERRPSEKAEEALERKDTVKGIFGAIAEQSLSV